MKLPLPVWTLHWLGAVHGPGAVCKLWAVCMLAAVPAAAVLPAELADGAPMPSLAPMLERTTPGVVNIATYASVRIRNPLLDDPFFRRFFNIPDERRRYRRERAAGSGVIVDAGNGYIVTNHHVVDRADEIVVGLTDGRNLPARLVGVDPQVDLAVLQVESEALTALEFADSAALRVGDFVVAVGNPFGLDQTVTSGIVSALGRSGLGIEGYEDFIQTDASINPGNSGGALVDLSGRVVGINTAIVSPGRYGGSVGIGFAIPSNMVAAIMEQLVTHGEVRRGRIGLTVQALDAELAEALGVGAPEGVVVVDVEPGSAADAAGIEPGDIVTAMAGREVRRVSDYHGQSALVMAGDTLVLRIARNGGERAVELEVDDSRAVSVPGARVDPRLAGSVLSDFREDDDPRGGAGVLVAEVERGSVAWRRGLREGDIIIAANRRQTRSVSALWQHIRDARVVRLRVYRAGQYGNIDLR